MVLADASSSQSAKFILAYANACFMRAFFVMTEITDEQVKSAIQAAARSLARTEQCRASLERKLRQKEFDDDSIARALDFLEEKRYLDDGRYAASWVRNHCAFKPQGTIRLVRELCMRGVSKEIASNAVKAYFEGVDETELCRRAFQKLLAKNKNEQKIMKSLAESGFSYKIIQSVIKSNKCQ